MSIKKFNDDEEKVEELCHGNALKASGSSEMTLVARTRIGWMNFRENR